MNSVVEPGANLPQCAQLCEFKVVENATGHVWLVQTAIDAFIPFHFLPLKLYNMREREGEDCA